MKSCEDGITAAILAGGLGSRLRSVIADRPKVLAPVADVPFLTHLLRQLGQANLGEAVLLVGYGAEQVRAEFGESQCGVRLGYSYEKELLGTGGAVRLALPLLKGKTLLLMNGDSYCNLDVRSFVDNHRGHGGRVSMTVTWVENASRFGRVELGPTDTITRFEEKAPVPVPGWINAGLYLIDRELFEAIPANVPISLERDLLPAWVSNREVLGYRGGEFIDIGIPETYARADAFFRVPGRSTPCNSN